MSTLQIVLVVIALLLIGVGYGKSKTWASKLRFTLFPISIVAFVTFIHFIIGCWEFNNLRYLIEENLTQVYNLQIVPLFLIAYCLFASVVICFWAWEKEGFANLKKSKEGGIVYWLIVGLDVMLAVAICWIIGGAFLGNLVGFIIIGSLLGAIFGFIPILVGFIKEGL